MISKEKQQQEREHFEESIKEGFIPAYYIEKDDVLSGLDEEEDKEIIQKVEAFTQEELYRFLREAGDEMWNGDEFQMLVRNKLEKEDY